MILYFSGTGNSGYVAGRISDITGDMLVCLNDKIKAGDYGIKSPGERLVIVTPTYAWRIPRVVENLIMRSRFNCDKVWFVMTCGSEIGNAEKYNKRLCEKKHFTYMGTAQIIMPENYIAMFSAPGREEAEKIIDGAGPDIIKAGERIKDGISFLPPRNNMYDRIMSGIVNGPFYKLYVKAKPFYTKDNCIGCGKCEALCPMNNINLKNGRPVWGENCTHCMACICRCPEEAIEYGKKSIGKPRYYCKK